MHIINKIGCKTSKDEVQNEQISIKKIKNVLLACTGMGNNYEDMLVNNNNTYKLYK